MVKKTPWKEKLPVGMKNLGINSRSVLPVTFGLLESGKLDGGVGSAILLKGPMWWFFRPIFSLRNKKNRKNWIDENHLQGKNRFFFLKKKVASLKLSQKTRIKLHRLPSSIKIMIGQYNDPRGSH